MQGAQRAIKYFALALAALLVVTIVSGIIGGLSFLGMIVWGDEVAWNGVSSEWTSVDYSAERITRLDVNVKATTVKIQQVKEGEPVRVETNNEYITTWVDGSKLTVVEKSHGIFGWGGTGDVVIYVREGAKFEEVEINGGAGKMDIEKLVVEELKLELGAGKTSIDELIVTKKAEIEGGAGMVEIGDGELHDLDFTIGAGKASVRAKVTGRGKVDSGVGKTELTLLGREGDYRVAIDKGIGSVTFNGMSLSDGQTVGNGSTSISVKSGVGAVEIKTTD